jgi:translin
MRPASGRSNYPEVVHLWQNISSGPRGRSKPSLKNQVGEGKPMENFDQIVERIHISLEDRTKVRDQALQQTRQLTRHCANAIRAVHRSESKVTHEHLEKARLLVDKLNKNKADYGDLYYAGYTQDALKEYAEATITHALINKEPLPTPEALNIEYATYLKGLAETAGELRRRCLDVLRHNNIEEAERLLGIMDEIYAVLVTMDYPSAITGGLRRLTDIVRGVTERTRGDMTMSLRQERLEKRLQAFEKQMAENQA